MPSSDRSLRIVIAGATTLRGKELVQVLGERIPQARLHLLDDEESAGLLTEAAGEPAVVQPVDAESFAGARIVFFAGTPEFTTKHAEKAMASGAEVVDLTGALAGRADARMWIPSLDAVLPPSFSSAKKARAYSSSSAPAIISCGLAAALNVWTPKTISIVFLQPVSELGQAGIHELESQTVKVLSFQPISTEVFGTQVAFNLSDRYGVSSKRLLGDTRVALARDVAKYLAGRARVPAVEVIQAPTFHAHGFSAFAVLTGSIQTSEIEKQLLAAGFNMDAADDAATNVGAAGLGHPTIGRIERDPNYDCGYWFWGTADSLRIETLNAAAIADRVLSD